MTYRPWIVGHNPAEPIGSSIGDGITGRVTDPTTGAGLFNPDLDPAVVGVDALTGSDAPVGTDMSFGAAIRRQMQTNVINGDFSVLPPLGASTNIDSDPASATYNPLPGWTWVPASDGNHSLSVVADAAYASGYKVQVTSVTATGTTSYLQQYVAVPMSQGQQYRVLLSGFASTTSAGLRYQFAKADLTLIGSPVEKVFTNPTAVDTKLDAGLVPPTAAYVLIQVFWNFFTNAAVGEVRCAFLPAEASLGLYARSAATSGITTTETQVAGITVPAGTFTVGSTYRLTAYGVATSTVINACTFRVRVGPTAGTGNIAGSRAPNSTAGATADGFKIEALFTVRSVGAGGTCIANVEHIGGPAQPFNTNAFVSGSVSTAAVDTTVANFLELTAQTAAGTTTLTFHQALIECVMAS